MTEPLPLSGTEWRAWQTWHRNIVNKYACDECREAWPCRSARLLVTLVADRSLMLANIASLERDLIALDAARVAVPDAATMARIYRVAPGEDSEGETWMAAYADLAAICAAEHAAVPDAGLREVVLRDLTVERDGVLYFRTANGVPMEMSRGQRTRLKRALATTPHPEPRAAGVASQWWQVQPTPTPHPTQEVILNDGTPYAERVMVYAPTPHPEDAR